MCLDNLRAILDLQGRLRADRTAATTRSDELGQEDDPQREIGPSEKDARSPGDEARQGPSRPEERAEDHPETSLPAQPSKEAGDQPSQPSSSGSIRFQDPSTARPRPPTVGETRAREKAERKRKALEKARVEAELKRYQRNQRLKGGAAVVGVVGVVVALGYWALSPRTVTAQCVQEDASGGPIIVPDSYCTGHGGGTGGLFIYSGHQYRYYYGSTGGVGARPSGGTTVAPKGDTVKTSSGTTIQRGGLGSKFSGSGGG